MPAPLKASNSGPRVSPERCRVALVLPSFAGGGAERVMIALMAGLAASSFERAIVVLDDQGPWRALVPADIPVTALGRPRLRRALLPLRRALARLDPDIVVSAIGYLNLGILALSPFLPAKTRFVVREANTPSRNARSGFGQWLYRRAYVNLYRRADAVISPSAAIAKELVESCGVPQRRLTVLPNPVDESGLRAAAAPPRRVAGGGRRFVAVGRLAPQKGFDRLIDAMAEMPADTHLTILGEGEERGALEARRKALGLEARIALPGFERSAASWMAGADALLLPSRWEGLPNVALEALAVGTQVVASAEAGAIGEIAAEAPPGAVRCVETDAAFGMAMKAVAPDPVSAVRASLLPAAFRLDAVVPRFAQLLRSRTDRA